MHVCDVIFPEGAPFVVEEPGFDAGDASHWPWLNGTAWSWPPCTSTGTDIWVTSKPHGVICATQSSQVPSILCARASWIETASSVSNARSTPGARAFMSRASWAGDAQRIARQDAELADLRQFKTLALSRLAAQHEEIHRLRTLVPGHKAPASPTSQAGVPWPASRAPRPAEPGAEQRRSPAFPAGPPVPRGTGTWHMTSWWPVLALCARAFYREQWRVLPPRPRRWPPGALTVTACFLDMPARCNAIVLVT